MKKLRLWALAALFIGLFVTACSSDEDEPQPAPATPVVELAAVSADGYTLTFTLTPRNASRAAWLCVPGGDPIPSAAEVLDRGSEVSASAPSTLTAAELEPATEYVIVAAVSHNGKSASEELRMTTSEASASSESHALIVFMQGDNGLETFMDTNLQRIVTAYYDLPADSKVVIFYDRGNYTRLTQLYMDDGMAKQRLIKEYNVNLSTVDPAFVKEVFELIKQEVSAESYGLILSSHGGGWVPSEIYDSYLFYDWDSVQRLSLNPSPLFYGQDGYDCMEIPDLVEAISTFHYDYILFDACFMASVEGLYDLRHSADYLIASSAEVLGDGFPYQTIIPLLFRPDHGLRRSCEAFMELYEGRSGTISLVEAAKLDGLAAAMRKVVAANDGTINVEQIQGYESFPIHLYYDLEQHVEQMTDDEALREEFRAALSEALPFTGHTPTFISTAYGQQTIALPRSCGLTCHVEREEFPETHAAYLQTAWAQAVGAR